MEDLLIAILQGLFEFALEVLANIPFDWPLSTRRTSDHIPAYGRDIVACLGITDCLSPSRCTAQPPDTSLRLPQHRVDAIKTATNARDGRISR
jgi:hypothetical protein